MKRNGTTAGSASSSRESIAMREEAAARASRNSAADETKHYHRVVSEKAEVRRNVQLQMEIKSRVQSQNAMAGVTNTSGTESMDISVITSLMSEYEKEHERLKELIMQPAAARRPRRAVERHLGIPQLPRCAKYSLWTINTCCVHAKKRYCALAWRRDS